MRVTLYIFFVIQFNLLCKVAFSQVAEADEVYEKDGEFIYDKTTNQPFTGILIERNEQRKIIAKKSFVQ